MKWQKIPDNEYEGVKCQGMHETILAYKVEDHKKLEALAIFSSGKGDPINSFIAQFVLALKYKKATTADKDDMTLKEILGEDLNFNLGCDYDSDPESDDDAEHEFDSDSDDESIINWSKLGFSKNQTSNLLCFNNKEDLYKAVAKLTGTEYLPENFSRVLGEAIANHNLKDLNLDVNVADFNNMIQNNKTLEENVDYLKTKVAHVITENENLKEQLQSLQKQTNAQHQSQQKRINELFDKVKQLENSNSNSPVPPNRPKRSMSGLW